MEVKVKVLLEVKFDGRVVDLIPRKATPGSAGYDLKAAEHAIIPAALHRVIDCEECGGKAIVHVPGRLAVRNGIALEIPPGFEGQVRPRSGTARKNGLGIPNSPATIDSDYRGELSTTLINFDGRPFEVFPGDRIGQILFAATADLPLIEVNELSETSRGSGGFGSTGRS